MSIRLNGANRYPHTQADEDFNKQMEALDQEQVEDVVHVAGRLAASTERASAPLVIDAPRAGEVLPTRTTPAAEVTAQAS